MRMLVLGNCPLERTQGSGYVTLGYVEGLRARGWQVDAFGPETVDPWPALGRARSLRLTLGLRLHAARALARKDYDVVELWGGEAWLAIRHLVARRGRRFLVVSHSNGLEGAFSAQLVRWLGADTLDGSPRRWFQLDLTGLYADGVRRADALVTVSANDRAHALRTAVQPPERVLAIENPLPPGFLRQPLLLEREPRIVYCGSWLALKGSAVLATDLSRVLAEFPGATLTLVGVGAGFEAHAWFDPAVLARVRVVPFLADRDMLREIYRESAIAVLPSVYESFGLAGAEAMACGCALVATRTGFAASLVDGREARLMSEPRSPALYEAVRGLLLDDAARRAIAAGGHVRVQSLRWPEAVATLAAAYERWLGELRGSRPHSAITAS